VVDLHFYACEIDGTPKPLLGQEIRWMPREELQTLRFPPADQSLIATLANAHE
jgi:hypothetical protein